MNEFDETVISIYSVSSKMNLKMFSKPAKFDLISQNYLSIFRKIYSKFSVKFVQNIP